MKPRFLLVSAHEFDGQSEDPGLFQPPLGRNEPRVIEVLDAGLTGRFAFQQLARPGSSGLVAFVRCHGAVLVGDVIEVRSQAAGEGLPGVPVPLILDALLESRALATRWTGPFLLGPTDAFAVVASDLRNVEFCVAELDETSFLALLQSPGFAAVGGEVGGATPAQIDIGDAGTAGVSTLAARQDHEHPFPAPVAPLTVRGIANLAGVGTRAAREDHRHRLELEVQLAGVLQVARPRLDFEGAVVVVDDVPGDRAVVTVTAATVGGATPAQLDIGDAGTAGVSTLAARQDHEHPFPAPIAPLTVRGVSNLAGVGTRAAREDHQHRLELEVLLAGVSVGLRPRLNFASGATVTDNPGGDRVDVSLVPLSAVPLSVTANATTGLGGAEIVLMSGNIVMPAGGGRIQIVASVGLNLGSVLIGTNGARIRLRVGGVLVPDSERSHQVSATLALALTLDAQEISAPGQVSGLAAGAALVEVLAVKLGAVSTASASGARSLHAWMLL